MVTTLQHTYTFMPQLKYDNGSMLIKNKSSVFGSMPIKNKNSVFINGFTLSIWYSLIYTQ
jgi:hypothetical protein